MVCFAGDHTNNDMAGDDDDSWKSQFETSKNFDGVKTQIGGGLERSMQSALCVAQHKSEKLMDAQ